MLSIVALLVGVYVLQYALRRFAALRRNIAEAKQMGFPYVVLPLSGMS